MGFAQGQDPMLNTDSFHSLSTTAAEWLAWLTALGGCFFIKSDEARTNFLSLTSCFFETQDPETLEEHVTQHGC